MHACLFSPFMFLMLYPITAWYPLLWLWQFMLFGFYSKPQFPQKFPAWIELLLTIVNQDGFMSHSRTQKAIDSSWGSISHPCSIPSLKWFLILLHRHHRKGSYFKRIIYHNWYYIFWNLLIMLSQTYSKIVIS